MGACQTNSNAKIRLLHTISKQQQIKNIYQIPKVFIEQGRYSMEEANS